MSIHVSRITTKGQVVIPKEFRDRTGLSTGDSVSLTTAKKNASLAKRSGWAHATAGCLPAPLPPLEPDELDELAESIAIEEAREKYGSAG